MTFFHPHELTKIVLKSSTKYYCTKLQHLAWRTEPKKFFLFFRVTYHTGRDQRVPPFNFFGTARLFSEIFFPKGPPSIFLLFCVRMDVGKSRKVPPFSFFGTEIFFRKFVFSPKGPPFNCDKNVDNFGSVPLLARHSVHFSVFSIFEYCKLTLGSPFAIFEPLIWRRLGPVPACLKKKQPLN